MKQTTLLKTEPSFLYRNVNGDLFDVPTLRQRGIMKDIIEAFLSTFTLLMMVASLLMIHLMSTSPLNVKENTLYSLL